MLHNSLLNIFAQRVSGTIMPSSGAGDYTDIHSMWHVTLVMAQLGRITYSYTPHLQPAITIITYHML